MATSKPPGGSSERILEPSERETIELESAQPEALPEVPEKPYTDWSPHEKRFIVFIASGAALFSPLSANIYYPIFNVLAEVLDVSNTLINVTVSTYMILQGLTPTFIAGMSDRLGRRPAYIVCFTTYLAANIGLALQTNYVALALLRCLQSAGSSSTVALARAVVADIAVPSERGLYVSLTSVGVFVGPSLGPVIGGLLSQYLSWRAVFWFLVISSGAFFAVLLIGYPETCRNVVEDGSVRPASWNLSVVSYLHLKRKSDRKESRRKSIPQSGKSPLSSLFQSVLSIFDKELGIINIASGITFAAFYAVSTAMPSIFGQSYGLNDLQIGLLFISAGVGSLISSLVLSKLVDWNYRRHATALGLPVKKGKDQDLKNFPIEAARLQIVLPALAFFILLVIAFGWITEYRLHISGPIVLIFFIGVTVTVVYSVLGVLIIDIWPGRAATATAGNNLVRCFLGAGATAAIVPMIERLGEGWAFTLIGFLCLATIPLLILCQRRGMRWRLSSH